ncbi:hypothetical protein F4778DRAFT_779952 [Xylariomycetidae sp. FL2044]|nr:hypothetical protein F4778DRAFT_779952 [Xylariomycetidae sp. FL2044]
MEPAPTFNPAPKRGPPHPPPFLLPPLPPLSHPTSETAELAAVMRKALNYTHNRHVFYDQPGQQPPTLSKKRVMNRIILFNGCFNPPHLGHMALLEDTFHHCGDDLEVIAAIVLVAPDGFLRWKIRSQDEVLIPEDQRIQLWNEELKRMGVGWCHVHSEHAWTHDHLKLEEEIRKQGFKVEFARIAGGDKVRTEGLAHGVWGCKKIIVSDICRPVDFYDRGTRVLKTLDRHDAWKQCRTYMAFLERKARETAEWSIANPVEAGDADADANDLSRTMSTVSCGSAAGPPRQGLGSMYEHELLRLTKEAKERDVWICDLASDVGKGTPYRTVRFIASKEQLDPDISSTNVRRIIATTPHSQLEDKLRDIALSVNLLVGIVKFRTTDPALRNTGHHGGCAQH